MNQPPLVPIHFDLSALVRKSVATFYSHLVTRPTGQALRLGIESQISELGEVCVSVLDFSQVVVLDYSCADEAIAKLLRRFQAEDRPVDAYFVALGVDERHLDTLETVLERQGVALVAEVVQHGFEPLGPMEEREAEVWWEVERRNAASLDELAAATTIARGELPALVDLLNSRRMVIRRADTVFALSALVTTPS